jgi:hypothetical protein
MLFVDDQTRRPKASRRPAGDNGKGRIVMGDKGKKDKDKGQKQKMGQKSEDAKQKENKQPKRKV